MSEKVDLNALVSFAQTSRRSLEEFYPGHDSMTFAAFLLNLGAVHAGQQHYHDQLVEALRSGSLKAGYLMLLRDELDRVLRESGKEE